MQRRLPKRGFTNIFKKEFLLVSVQALAENFKDGDSVDLKSLLESGLLSRADKHVKLLADGDIDFKLKVRLHAASKAAKAKIEAAGGEFVFIGSKAASKDGPKDAVQASQAADAGSQQS